MRRGGPGAQDRVVPHRAAGPADRTVPAVVVLKGLGARVPDAGDDRQEFVLRSRFFLAVEALVLQAEVVRQAGVDVEAARTPGLPVDPWLAPVLHTF